MKRKVFGILIIMTAFFANAANMPEINKPNFLDLPALKKEKNKNVIKLYPNPTWDGRVNISVNNSEPLHFYVFDVSGTLIHQITLKGKKKYKIANLKKGIYMYDVFSNDESIENGKIIVK
ncbi:MAG TPA: T9SS type A sorting domain-containing protein [Chitinophagaceae bacterium]|nr:T9SS type A sorting domain-containing protein [Chitinophagaceae bacterium]